MIVRWIILGVLVAAVFGLLGAIFFLPALLTVLATRSKSSGSFRGASLSLQTGYLVQADRFGHASTGGLAHGGIPCSAHTDPAAVAYWNGRHDTAALPSTSESVQTSDAHSGRSGPNALTGIDVIIQTDKRDSVVATVLFVPSAR